MIFVIECIALCLLFTLMVYLMSRDPIKTLYNYPPKIQERVKSLKEYKNSVPAKENKIVAKSLAVLIIIAIFSFLLKYINGYTTFVSAFGHGFLLWTIINLYDMMVLDIMWFCHDPYFVFKGTEDMVDEYHNYLFHIKGFFIGEFLALFVCAIVGLMVQFII